MDHTHQISYDEPPYSNLLLDYVDGYGSRATRVEGRLDHAHQKRQTDYPTMPPSSHNLWKILTDTCSRSTDYLDVDNAVHDWMVEERLLYLEKRYLVSGK